VTLEPAWGYVYVNGCHLECSIKSLDGLTRAVHVHGGGDPLPPIVALCRSNGWVGFDTTVGDFIALERPSRQGWDQFRHFRDQAVGRLQKD